MDFFKLIKSLDELVYEVLSWMLFYPITLWRVLVHPARAMLLAENELRKEEGEPAFDTMLGPPLFLFLTLLLIHVAELFLNPSGGDELIKSNVGISRYITNDTNLVIFRVIVFGLLPLTAARRLLRIRGMELNKEMLRAPFYAQCYSCAIYSILLNAGTFVAVSKLDYKLPIGLGLVGISIVWFLVVEAHWFAARQRENLLKGFWNAVVVFAEWSAIVFLLFLVAR